MSKTLEIEATAQCPPPPELPHKIKEVAIMWTEGNVNGYEYTAKVFDEASSMGINGGRVSKLDMTKGGKLVASYDRGWDMKPTTTDEKAAVKELLRRFK